MDNPNHHPKKSAKSKELSAKTIRKQNQTISLVKYHGPKGVIETFTVCRNEIGFFKCVFCDNTYGDPTGLQKHASTPKHFADLEKYQEDANTKQEILNRRYSTYRTIPFKPSYATNNEPLPSAVLSQQHRADPPIASSSSHTANHPPVTPPTSTRHATSSSLLSNMAPPPSNPSKPYLAVQELSRSFNPNVSLPALSITSLQTRAIDASTPTQPTTSTSISTSPLAPRLSPPIQRNASPGPSRSISRLSTASLDFPMQTAYVQRTPSLASKAPSIIDSFKSSTRQLFTSQKRLLRAESLGNPSTSGLDGQPIKALKRAWTWTSTAEHSQLVNLVKGKLGFSKPPPSNTLNDVIDLTIGENAPEVPLFDPNSYRPVPDENTILKHAIYNLPAWGIAINKLLKCVVCIECQDAIDPKLIRSHARRHNPHHSTAESVIDQLVQEYSLVALEDVAYPDHAIPPVFGICIESEPLHFCSSCHRGFKSIPALRSHQSNLDRCDASRNERSSYLGYGQRLTKGRHKRFFPIDTSGLPNRYSITPDYSAVFNKTLPPPVDYTKLPIRAVEDPQNLSSFLYREGWLQAVQGYKPADIVEATRLPTVEDEPWGKALQKAAHRSMERVQLLIGRYHAFGLTEAIAQTYAL